MSEWSVTDGIWSKPSVCFDMFDQWVSESDYWLCLLATGRRRFRWRKR